MKTLATHRLPLPMALPALVLTQRYAMARVIHLRVGPPKLIGATLVQLSELRLV